MNKTKVIAVGSGKGGVGKSTVSALIALALKNLGYSVGLMDADLYGPSVPHLLGEVGGVVQVDGKIQPLFRHGIATLSVGYMTDPNAAMIWRGPLIHGVLQQFFNDTRWEDESGKELDFLIIDMPPGTGDVPISINQLTQLAGGVVVCTPQQMALIDAKRAVGMLQKMDVPILGLIENMSYFKCDECGKEHNLFGRGGVKQYAEQTVLPFLGELPMVPTVEQLADQGALFDLEKNESLMAPYIIITKNLLAEIEKNPVMPKLNMV